MNDKIFISGYFRRCIMCGRAISSDDYYMYECRCKDCFLNRINNRRRRFNGQT